MSVLDYLLLAVVACVLVMALWLHSQALKAKRQAQDGDKNFKGLFEEIPLACQEVDLGGVIRRVNQKMCDLRGLRSSDILGKHYADFAAEGEKEKVQDKIRRKLTLQEPLVPSQQTYVRNNGEVVAVQVHEILLRDAKGAVAGLRSYALDVTERIRKEDEIWQTTEELRALFQALPDVFLRLDTAGVIVDYRGPKPSAFAVGKALQSLVSPEAGRQIEKAMARVRQSSALVAIEYSLPSGVGETYFEARFIPLHWKEIIVMVRDISERKRAAKRLEQYSEEVQEKNHDLAAALATAREATLMKGRFLANMSHEIRTPMNGVLGMTQLLLDTPLNPEQREYAEAVQQSAQALTTVTNDILDLSKIEAGRLTIESIPFDMTATVKEIIAGFAIRARSKGLNLDSILPSGAPLLVRGDPGRLRQILTNLIGNAIKFTESGNVAVRMELIGDARESVTVKFYVEDTGIGISSEHRGQIFQAFMQGDSSTTRKYGGTGLGLAIAKQLVELLGGEIGVESQGGRGSTFWFSALFEKQLAQQPPSTHPPAAIEAGIAPGPGTPLNGMRALLVTGAAAKPAGLREILKSWGCEIDQLSSAAWVVPELRLAAQTGNPFHIVLLDIDMPDVDPSIGLDIAADKLVFDTDLVAMTSTYAPANEAGLREKGFSAYLAKPVSPEELHRVLMTVWHSAPAAAAVQAPEERLPRVLLAEDNPINQKLALRLLEKAGLKADVVANGSQAVAAIGKTTYDVILMDCQMPEMDGFEATAEIRRLEGNTRHTTICALTAHAMAGDRERCLNAGMDDYITKPLTVKVLHNKIAAWIHAKQPDPNESQSLMTTA